jgi:hypothetical protein
MREPVAVTERGRVLGKGRKAKSRSTKAGIEDGKEPNL